MSLIFGESFEHLIAPGTNLVLGGGAASTSIENRKLWDAQVNASALSIETTTVPPGAGACLKMEGATVTAAANLSRSFSDTTGTFGFWFRKVGSTNPSAVNPRIVGLNPSNHIVRLSSGGVLQIAAANANPQTIITPTADTWYWITVSFDTSSGTHTCTAKAYDTSGSLLATSAASTATLATAAQTSFILGTGGSIGGATVLVGVPVLSDALADFPIQPMGTDLLVPTACGTHSFSAGVFKDDTAGNLATNETTSWDKLNEKPPNSTDWVQQASDAGTSYVEYVMSDVSTSRSLGDVSFVQVIGAHIPSTTGANSVNVKIVDGSTADSTLPFDASLTANTLEYHIHGYVAPPAGGAWTTAKANALKTRFGYLTASPALGAISAIYVQVFAPLTFGTGAVQQGGPLAVTGSTTATVAGSRPARRSGALTATASGTITVAARHVAQKGGALAVTAAGAITIAARHVAQKAGVLAVSAAGAVTVAASHRARKAGVVALTNAGVVTVANSGKSRQGGALAVTAAGAVSVAGSRPARRSGAVAVTSAGSVLVSAGHKAGHGTLAVSGGTSVTVASRTRAAAGGVIQVSNASAVSTGGRAARRGGALAATADGSISVAGSVRAAAGGPLEVSAGTLVVVFVGTHTTWQGGALSVSSTSTIDVAAGGRARQGGAATVSATGAVAVSGSARALRGAAVSIEAATIADVLSGRRTPHGGPLALEAGTLVTVAGSTREERPHNWRQRTGTAWGPDRGTSWPQSDDDDWPQPGPGFWAQA